MEKSTLEFIESLIYDSTREEVVEAIGNISDSSTLHVFMCSYNWDDGLEIPAAVLSNKNCELATALMIFYQAEGERYLSDREAVKKDYSDPWAEFIEKLYERIINGGFVQGDILFEPPLVKVQLFRLSKVLNVQEQVFTQAIGSTNLNIVV